jgi:hypothetical protein
VFENRVLRKMFGSKRDEVTGSWRKLHNDELYNMYFSIGITRIMTSKRRRGAWDIARIKTRNAYRLLVGKPDRKDRTSKTKT